MVVALGDVNRFTWTWLPITNPARANQVTWDCLVVWLAAVRAIWATSPVPISLMEFVSCNCCVFACLFVGLADWLSDWLVDLLPIVITTEAWAVVWRETPGSYFFGLLFG